MSPDFRVIDGGSVFLLTPLTPSGQQWVEDNLPAEALRYAGAIAIEHRYIDPIVEGLMDAGLTLEAH
jgi:hypothetical protein